MLHYLFKMFYNKYKNWLLNLKIIVVSKRTYNIAKEIGWKKIYTSKSAKNEDLVNIIVSLHALY